MLLGMTAWRAGVWRQPAKHRRLLGFMLAVPGSLGALTTTLLIWANETGQSPPGAFDLLYPFSSLLLAFGIGAGFLLWLTSTKTGLLTRLLAAAGRMALSNYLAQSVIFSVMFFGFGLFGKLGSAVTAMLGVAVFAGQLITSRLWLQRYQFGPAEWFWRSLTYGRWQPLRRTAGAVSAAPTPAAAL